MIKQSRFGASAAVTPTPPPPPPPPPPIRARTMKIENCQNWLGNTIEENKRLDYAIANGINSIELYGLYSVFGTSLEPLLKPFIEKARVTYGLLYVGCIMGAGHAGFDLALNYNAGATANQQFNNFNKENEFWRYPATGTETYAAWIASLNYLYPLLNHATQVLSAYVQNNGTWSGAAASDMVAVIDIYQATNYTTSPNETPVRAGQLQFIATAAAAAAKLQMVQPLWSAETVYMGPYLAANGMLAGETDWNTQYAADGFADKSSLDIIGMNYFAYNKLIAVIP